MDHNVVVRRCRQERGCFQRRRGLPLSLGCFQWRRGLPLSLGCFQRRRGLRVRALFFVLQRAVKETKPKEGYNYLQCTQESSARCIEGGIA